MMAKGQRDTERDAKWRALLDRFAGSGLSVREFCLREKLTESSFYFWRRTIAERDRLQQAKPIKKAGSPAFVPVVVRDGPAPVGITIELHGGRVLRLPTSIEMDRLSSIIRAVEAAS